MAPRARSGYFAAMSLRLSCVLVAALAALSACERPRAPVNGIGGFQLAKTQLGAVDNLSTARCFQSQDRMSCMILARQTIADRTPQIQLEFAGSLPTSLLRRILLEIPGCELGEVRSWFEERIGKANRADDASAIWQQKYMVLGLWVSSPGRCQVAAVDPVDEPNVEALLREHGPKAAP